jgi:hypothetical protein
MREKDAEGALHLLNYRGQELTLEHFWKFGIKGALNKLRDLSFRLRRAMKGFDSIEVITDMIRESSEQAAKFRQGVTSIFDYYVGILHDDALFSPDFSVSFIQVTSRYSCIAVCIVAH